MVKGCVRRGSCHATFDHVCLDSRVPSFLIELKLKMQLMLKKLHFLLELYFIHCFLMFTVNFKVARNMPGMSGMEEERADSDYREVQLDLTP